MDIVLQTQYFSIDLLAFSWKGEFSAFSVVLTARLSITMDNTWEKPRIATATRKSRTEYLKFLIGGLLMLAAVVYLILSGTASGAQYFINVDDLVKNPDYVGKTVRMSGAVIGDSIVYDTRTLSLDFTIANIDSNTTDLARTLHEAVLNTSATQLKVHLDNEVKPDLLQNEAQAILTGKLGADGVFYATELLLKCPSRYQESVPSQVQAGA
jgi:cytochrome c-type biogenesis protein CcmE